MGNNFGVVFSQLKKMCRVSQKNADLSAISSFGIGGRAKILLEPESLEEIIKIIDYVSRREIKYQVVGNSTNILYSDAGFCGVVIKVSNRFGYIEMRDGCVVADSGASLSAVTAFAIDHGLGGLEDGFGIPGTIGGAVVMNAGAYGFKIENVVKSVIALVDGKIKIFNNSECGFGYRKSVFKNTNSIVLRVELNLDKSDKKSLITRRDEILKRRSLSQPIGKRSAGSVFKNPDGLSVGRLIEESGLKGVSFGGAMVSEKHANFIVNMTNATAKDVLTLIDRIKKEIFDRYNIRLEEEIIYVK